MNTAIYFNRDSLWLVDKLNLCNRYHKLIWLSQLRNACVDLFPSISILLHFPCPYYNSYHLKSHQKVKTNPYFATKNYISKSLLYKKMFRYIILRENIWEMYILIQCFVQFLEYNTMVQNRIMWIMWKWCEHEDKFMHPLFSFWKIRSNYIFYSHVSVSSNVESNKVENY